MLFGESGVRLPCRGRVVTFKRRLVVNYGVDNGESPPLVKGDSSCECAQQEYATVFLIYRKVH
jgi:hypothetical protein